MSANAIEATVLTLSDTRGSANDPSGDYLAEQLVGIGYRPPAREWSKDDIYQIRAVVSKLIAQPKQSLVLACGGTGLMPRDSTPEAICLCWIKKLSALANCFVICRMKKSARPLSIPGLLPAWPTALW